jgi:transposase
LLAAGASAPEIAHRLYLSRSTVKTYLHRRYESSTCPIAADPAGPERTGEPDRGGRAFGNIA